MKRIMFVCHGNICRSPMAEYIFKKLIKEKGIENDFYVASSATSTEEIHNGKGNPVHPLAQRELAMHRITCKEKRATLLQKSDYDNYDLFIGMDSANIKNMMRIFGEDKENKVHKLLEYAPKPKVPYDPWFRGHEPKPKDDIADPWYHRRFDITYAEIRLGCTELLKKLTEDTEKQTV